LWGEEGWFSDGAWLGAAKPQPDSLFVEGHACPAACHVLQIFFLLVLWDFASGDVRFAEFAPLLIANSLRVVARAHEQSAKFDAFFRAFAMEGLLPSFALFHFEFRKLVQVNELVALLLSASLFSIFALAFFSLFSLLPPIPLIGVVFLALQFGGRVKGRWECDAESGKEIIHMKVIKVDHPLVHVFSIRALVAVFEEELDLFVYSPKDFSCETVVCGDSIFVDDVVLGDLYGKILELNCQDTSFSKNELAGQRECFHLEEEGVEVLRN
jgi:hypothetical protein